MDKSRFTDRPGDSEGFVEEQGAVTNWARLSDETLDRVHAIWCGQSARILAALGEIMRANQPRRRAR
jgi:hypothetical protein